MSNTIVRSTPEARLCGRRQFLTGTGSACLVLPPLISLMPRAVAAQTVSGRKNRSVTMLGVFGVDPHQLFPPNQTDLTPVAGAESVRWKKLDALGPRVSRIIDADFAPMYPKMNLIQGMSLTGGNYTGHNTSVLSGTHSGARSPVYGKSIDVIMEKSPGVYRSTDTVVRKAIRLSSGQPDSAFSFDRVDGARVVTDKLLGDRALFNTLFSRLGAASGPGPSTGEGKLIVDRVHADLKTLERNPRLSREDRLVLDHYVSSVFELQRKVAADQMGGGVQCAKPTSALEVTGNGNSYKFPDDPAWGVKDRSKLFDNYVEMIKIAFICDLTRVVYIGNTLYVDTSGTGGGLHHECPSSDLAADRQKWGLKKLLKLAKDLDAVKDPFGGGSLLDNSVLLYLNELGAWTTSHNVSSVPALTFGSGAGYFKTGYFVDYRQQPLRTVKGYPIGRPLKQLLQSVMSSMGVPRAEYMAYGDGNGFGEFKPGINQFGFNDPAVFARYAKEHNDPLPFLSNVA